MNTKRLTLNVDSERSFKTTTTASPRTRSIENSIYSWLTNLARTTVFIQISVSVEKLNIADCTRFKITTNNAEFENYALLFCWRKRIVQLCARGESPKFQLHLLNNVDRCGLFVFIKLPPFDEEKNICSKTCNLSWKDALSPRSLWNIRESPNKIFYNRTIACPCVVHYVNFLAVTAKQQRRDTRTQSSQTEFWKANKSFDLKQI